MKLLQYYNVLISITDLKITFFGLHAVCGIKNSTAVQMLTSYMATRYCFIFFLVFAVIKFSLLYSFKKELYVYIYTYSGFYSEISPLAVPYTRARASCPLRLVQKEY